MLLRRQQTETDIYRKIKEYVKDLEARLEKAKTTILELDERVETLETKAETAKTALQGHNTRITTLEGYHT